MLQVIRELVLKLSAPNRHTSRSVAEGVTGLDHELWNDTVEYNAFEVPAPRVTNKVLDGLWRLRRE
jgi:hypothetical protein